MLGVGAIPSVFLLALVSRRPHSKKLKRGLKNKQAKKKVTFKIKTPSYKKELNCRKAYYL